MMDFSGSAGAGSDFDLLPKGLLVWAILQVRGVKASGSGGGYLDCELTVDAGQPYAGRKLWEMIGDPNNAGNSEKYRQMGQIAITRILECTGAGPQNPDGYKIASYDQLSNRRVAIKVGIEEGTGGHDDKNRVAEWLTPNPASQSGHKGFQKLMAGDHGLQQQQQSQQSFGSFGGAATGQQASAGFGNGGGFGQGGAAPQPTQPQTSGFGNTSPGFTQPAPGSSGQAPGFNATNAANGSSTTGASASPSNGEQAPNWLQQAGGQQG
jgi:hypothetical protein